MYPNPYMPNPYIPNPYMKDLKSHKILIIVMAFIILSAISVALLIFVFKVIKVNNKKK